MQLRQAGRGAALAALVAGAAMAGPAQGATTTHPGGGSDFDGGAGGWTGSDASCAPAGGGTLLCDAATEHVAEGGNPGGALRTRADVTLNVAGAFSAGGTWTSPAFAVPAERALDGARFAYDRRLDAGGLIDLTPSAEVTVELVDREGRAATPLLTETLTPADAFAGGSAAVPAGGLTPGRAYRLRIRTDISSTAVALAVQGSASALFDNVRLIVTTSPPVGGEQPVGSEGVTVRRDSVSDREISSLVSRLDETRERGDGAAGSIVPLARCSVIGTAGDDRIVGSKGNDVICGLGGRDVVVGGGGRDVIDGANGNDRLGGGAGADLIAGLDGRDRLSGGAGRDRVGGGKRGDVLDGGGSGDRLSGGSGADRLSGGGSGDRLSGGSGADRLSGGRGRDRLRGGAGADRIRARDRTRDRIDGGRGRDRAAVDRPARGARRGKRASRRSDVVRRVERRR